MNWRFFSPVSRFLKLTFRCPVFDKYCHKRALSCMFHKSKRSFHCLGLILSVRHLLGSQGKESSTTPTGISHFWSHHLLLQTSEPHQPSLFTLSDRHDFLTTFSYVYEKTIQCFFIWIPKFKFRSSKKQWIFRPSYHALFFFFYIFSLMRASQLHNHITVTK